MSLSLRLKYNVVHREVHWLKEHGYVEEKGQIRNGRHKPDGRGIAGTFRPTTLWGIQHYVRVKYPQCSKGIAK
jgi:hypothetical protein